MLAALILIALIVAASYVVYQGTLSLIAWAQTHRKLLIGVGIVGIILAVLAS